MCDCVLRALLQSVRVRSKLMRVLHPREQLAMSAVRLEDQMTVPTGLDCASLRSRVGTQNSNGAVFAASDGRSTTSWRSTTRCHATRAYTTSTSTAQIMLLTGSARQLRQERSPPHPGLITAAEGCPVQGCEQLRSEINSASSIVAPKSTPNYG